jgi:hypothetical protein
MAKLTQTAVRALAAAAKSAIRRLQETFMEKVPIRLKMSKRDLAINNFMC